MLGVGLASWVSVGCAVTACRSLSGWLVNEVSSAGTVVAVWLERGVGTVCSPKSRSSMPSPPSVDSSRSSTSPTSNPSTQRSPRPSNESSPRSTRPAQISPNCTVWDRSPPAIILGHVRGVSRSRTGAQFAHLQRHRTDRSFKRCDQATPLQRSHRFFAGLARFASIWRPRHPTLDVVMCARSVSVIRQFDDAQTGGPVAFSDVRYRMVTHEAASSTGTSRVLARRPSSVVPGACRDHGRPVDSGVADPDLRTGEEWWSMWWGTQHALS